MINSLSQLVDMICKSLIFDIAVMGNPWMYYPLLIPAVIYTLAMTLKWTAITMPIWLPIRMVATAFRKKDPDSDPLGKRLWPPLDFSKPFRNN